MKGVNHPNVCPGPSSLRALICRCPAGAFLAANLSARAAAGGCFRARCQGGEHRFEPSMLPNCAMVDSQQESL